MVEESNSGAEKNRRDVDADFIEEAGIQALLDCVGAVDADGLPDGGGFGFVQGAFDAVGYVSVQSSWIAAIRRGCGGSGRMLPAKRDFRPGLGRRRKCADR
jgi:hypothetical protein